VALATVRLTFELRERARQLAELASELQACQARMVVARSDERRRLLLRVETAVVPQLDETDAALRSLGETANSPGAIRSIEEARDAAMASLEAVRGVARGIFPNLLADAGIAAALRSWGEERVPPVGVAVAGDLSGVRTRPAVEAALYFACVGALGSTDASAPAIPVTVELAIADPADGEAGSTVEMSVPLPMPQPRPRSSPVVEPETLLAIRDRIGALGGTVTVDIAPDGEGRMTVVVALEREDDPVPAGDGAAP
jgi:signal transduction histidine kinase